MASAIHAAAHTGKNVQPGVVAMDLVLTGAAAATYATMAAGADNDNRLVTSVTRTGAGVYDIVLNQVGRVLLSCLPTWTAASENMHLWSVSLSGATLTIKVKDADAGTALDIPASDILRLHLRFKNCGA